MEDQFWLKWKITPLVDDVPVTSNEFWNRSELDKITFRCKASNAVVESTFWAVSEPIRDGRLVLRGVYLPYELRFRENPFLWLSLFLFGGVGFNPLPACRLKSKESSSTIDR